MKKYADALTKVVKERGIEVSQGLDCLGLLHPNVFHQVNFRRHLVEVDSDRKVAYFQDLEDPDKKPIGVEV